MAPNPKASGLVLSALIVPLAALVFLLFAYRGAFVSRDLMPLVFALILTVLGAVGLLPRRRVAFWPRLGLVLLGSALAFLSVAAHNGFKAAQNRAIEEPARAALVGRGAPPLQAFRSFNFEGDLSNALGPYAGKVVLVDFWATWCSPCLRSMPELEEAQRRLGREHFQVLGITRLYRPDAREAEIQEVGEFVRRLGVTYPILISDSEAIHDAYHVRALPTTVVIDQQGKIRFYGIGVDASEEALRLAESLLPE